MQSKVAFIPVTVVQNRTELTQCLLNHIFYRSVVNKHQNKMYRQGISYQNLPVKILEPKDCTAVSSKKSTIVLSFKGRICLFSSRAILVKVSLCQISKQTFKLLSEITNSSMQLIAACCYAVEIHCHHMLWMWLQLVSCQLKAIPTIPRWAYCCGVSSRNNWVTSVLVTK